MFRTLGISSTRLVSDVSIGRWSACVLSRFPLTCDMFTRNIDTLHMRLPRRTSYGLLVANFSRLPSRFLSHRFVTNVRANVWANVMADQCYLLRRALAKRNRFVLTSICGSVLTGAVIPVSGLSVMRRSVNLVRISPTNHEFVTIFACAPANAV